MKNLISKTKIVLIALLVVLVAGIVLFGVMGLNKSEAFGESYQVEIAATIDFTDHADTIKETAEEVFKKNGLSVADYTLTQEYGSVSIFLFNEKLSDAVLTELKNAVTTAISTGSVPIEVTVNQYAASVMQDASIRWQVIVGTIGAIVAFGIYLMFRQRFVNAFAVMVSTVLEGGLFVAIASLVRIPATTAFYAIMLASIALTAVLATVYTGKAKEYTKKYTEDAKASAAELSAKLEKNNVAYVLIFTVAAVLFAVAFLALGPALMRWTGLMLVAAIVAVDLTVLFVLPYFWFLFRKVADNKKNKFAYKPTESVSGENK